MLIHNLKIILMLMEDAEVQKEDAASTTALPDPPFFLQHALPLLEGYEPRAGGEMALTRRRSLAVVGLIYDRVTALPQTPCAYNGVNVVGGAVTYVDEA